MANPKVSSNQGERSLYPGTQIDDGSCANAEECIDLAG